MGWFVFWFTVSAVAIVGELISLGTKGIPLTKVYLRLACSTFLRSILFAFFFWMTWHWMIQPWLWADTNGFLLLDFAFIAVGGLVGWKVGPPKWGVNCGDGLEPK